jgi:hypothetical protein
MSRETLTRRAALVTMVVVTIAALAWALWPDRHESAPAVSTPLAVVPGTVLKAKACYNPPAHAFAPATISVPKVARDATVHAEPRDAENVPGALPLSAPDAKTAFAWDKPTIKPGEPKGNVLINAHTWPDGTALGNKLLAHLHVGGRITVKGKNGQEICYKVTKRFVIVASDGSAEYYEKDGPPQIALIVCSPPRLGPGNWYHRTIWFASPMAADGSLVT